MHDALADVAHGNVSHTKVLAVLLEHLELQAAFGIADDLQPVGGGRFPVKYYLTAMLFIVFDIEIVFLYPWAVAFDQLALFGLFEMIIFIVTVLVVYAYVWRRRGLEWD